MQNIPPLLPLLSWFYVLWSSKQFETPGYWVRGGRSGHELPSLEGKNLQGWAVLQAVCLFVRKVCASPVPHTSNPFCMQRFPLHLSAENQDIKLDPSKCNLLLHSWTCISTCPFLSLSLFQAFIEQGFLLARLILSTASCLSQQVWLKFSYKAATNPRARRGHTTAMSMLLYARARWGGVVDVSGHSWT